MKQIDGTITTVHGNAGCVAAALSPDNLRSMTTTAAEGIVVTRISGTSLRSVIASVDDYLLNLGVADDTCTAAARHGGNGKN